MSGAYGEPDWASPTASSSTPAAPAASAASGGGGNTSSWTANEDFGASAAAAGAGATVNASGFSNAPINNVNCIQRLLSLLCIGLCAMMCCLGVFGIMGSSELSEVLVSAYMILFSVLLFLYELMWWKPISIVNKSLRMNFGFMYYIKGKAAYMIFVAFIVIGLRNDVSIKGLRYATGGSFLAVGVLLFFLDVYKPDLLSSYKAPTRGFDNSATNPV